MSLDAAKAKGGAPRTPPLEVGLYKARLVQVVDLGLQPRSFKGEDKEPQQQIMLTYELVDEFLLDEDGDPMPDKPRWLSETFGLNKPNVERAKSTARLKVLSPNGANSDFGKLLGLPVILNVLQNPSKDKTKVYNKIDAVMTMKAKDQIDLPALVNAARSLDLDAPNAAVFAELPDWVKEKIRESLEFKGSKAEEVLGSGTEVAKAQPADKEEADGNPF